MIVQPFRYHDQYLIAGEILTLREVLEAFLQHFEDCKQYARGVVELAVNPDGQLVIRREVIPGGIMLSIPFAEFVRDFLPKKYDP